MEFKDIIYLIVLGSIILIGLATIIYSLIRGEIKKYVIECMKQADFIYKDLPKPEKSIKKLEYVVKYVSEKYGIVKLFLNIRKFVEKIIEIANSLQNKGKGE